MATPVAPVEHTTELALSEKRKLVKSLGHLDMVFFTVCAIVGLDLLGQAASYGAQAFTWVVVLVVLFMFPYALLMAELGTAFPQEGGHDASQRLTVRSNQNPPSDHSGQNRPPVAERVQPKATAASPPHFQAGQLRVVPRPPDDPRNDPNICNDKYGSIVAGLTARKSRFLLYYRPSVRGGRGLRDTQDYAVGAQK